MSNAQSLEETLRHIERLNKDLYAEHIVQHEISHYVEDNSMNVGVSHYKFIDQSEISEPDAEKIWNARSELLEIHESSPFYSPRYASGRLLGISKENLYEKVKDWLVELNKAITNSGNSCSSAFEDARTFLRMSVKSPEKKFYLDFGKSSRYPSFHPECPASIIGFFKDIYKNHPSRQLRKKARRELDIYHDRLWPGNMMIGCSGLTIGLTIASGILPALAGLATELKLYIDEGEYYKFMNNRNDFVEAIVFLGPPLLAGALGGIIGYKAGEFIDRIKEGKKRKKEFIKFLNN